MDVRVEEDFKIDDKWNRKEKVTDWIKKKQQKGEKQREERDRQNDGEDEVGRYDRVMSTAALCAFYRKLLRHHSAGTD